VRVCVAEWEFGCCAPAPEIGAPTSWVLRHRVAGPEPDPLLDEEHEWTVGRDGLLRRGGLVALPAGAGAAPAPGTAVLRGCLWGTVHVGPEECPPVTGRVERMRLLRRPRGRPAGSVTAQDVAECALDPADPAGDEGGVVAVLLDVVLLGVAAGPGWAPPPSG
jgi:hypothetical protein